MIRISSLAVATACSGLLLGFAIIGAAPVVLAGEAKPKLISGAPRIQAQALPQLPANAAYQIRQALSPADEPRRPERVVYVGPITGR